MLVIPTDQSLKIYFEISRNRLENITGTIFNPLLYHKFENMVIFRSEFHSVAQESSSIKKYLLFF